MGDRIEKFFSPIMSLFGESQKRRLIDIFFQNDSGSGQIDPRWESKLKIFEYFSI